MILPLIMPAPEVATALCCYIEFDFEDIDPCHSHSCHTVMILTRCTVHCEGLLKYAYGFRSHS